MSARRGHLNGKKIRADRERAGLTLDQAAALLDLEPHVLAGLEEDRRTLTPKRAEDLTELMASEYKRRILQNAAKARIAENGPASIPGAARPPVPADPGREMFEGTLPNRRTDG